MRYPVVAYVTICATCLHEQYFPKQRQANAAGRQHKQTHPAHVVRVTRVKNLGGHPATRPSG